MSVSLWPHQTKAFAMLADAFRRGLRALILVISTGGGKTNTAAAFIEAAIKKGSKVIFCVPRIELLIQASRKLDEYGIHHGLISPHYKQTTDHVQVASVQTLVRRLDKLPWVPTILVLDEGHMSVNPTYRKVISRFPNAFLLALTATPWRLDSKGLGKQAGGHFDGIIEPTSMQELIDGGYLVKPVVYAPSVPNLTGVRTVMGDYDHNQLEQIMDKKTLVGDTVQHYLRLARGRPAIAFCVSIAHAEHVAEQFRAAGVRAKAVSGNTPTAERLDAVKALGDGRLDVVANCALWIEGLDQPAVSCIILLSPTQSLTRYLQSVGRGMRRYPGKKNLIVLDHAGCCLSHGLPQDKREWSLDGERKKSKASDSETIQRAHMCPRCYGMNPIHRDTCEQCGHIFEPQREPPKQTEGELVEITEAQREAMRLSARREQGRAQTREELEAIAKAKGYKPQWVHYVMKARQRRATA